MMTLPPVLYQGSVKNVRGIEGQNPYIFEYSDRYSIFDWGQMPDLLNGKGEALAFMGWFFFDFLGRADNWANWAAPQSFQSSAVLAQLKRDGARHHATGLVNENLKTLSFSEKVLNSTRYLSVQPIGVLRPECRQNNSQLVWDYGAYRVRPSDVLVPLEVIFRFGVPEGSSLLKRTNDPEYCSTLGLEKSPKEGDRFHTPVIEFSTKLETSDRYLSYAEAQDIAGLTAEEFFKLKELTALIALRLRDCFQDIGVELWDGKFEFSFTTDQKNPSIRDFMLVDSIGPDELRLIYDGVHLSKEILRLVYRPLSWHEDIETAKKLAKERGEKDWKRICVEELRSLPPALSAEMKTKAEMIYKGLSRALAEKFYARTIFSEAWPLSEVVKNLKPEKA